MNVIVKLSLNNVKALVYLLKINLHHELNKYINAYTIRKI